MTHQTAELNTQEVGQLYQALVTTLTQLNAPEVGLREQSICEVKAALEMLSAKGVTPESVFLGIRDSGNEEDYQGSNDGV